MSNTNNKISEFCNTCNGNRNHQILVEKELVDADEYGSSYYNRYQVIQCLGCDYIHFRKEMGGTDYVNNRYNTITGEPELYHDPDVYIYPSKDKECVQPKQIHFNQNAIPVSLYYTESITALNNDSLLLSALGLRACLERFCHYNGILTGTLQNKIDELKTKSKITEDECKLLHGIRFIGNESAHDIAPLIKKNQIKDAIDILEMILIREFNSKDIILHKKQQHLNTK